jgi:hypothetical protein
MRVEASVTSVSWIPSEALTGLTRIPIDLGVGRYDDPPPDRLEDLESLQEQGRFRFANHLAAWAEVIDGHVVNAGYSGRGYICPTELSLGVGQVAIAAISLPDLQAEPIIGPSGVTFTQTCGGRTGAPLPRRISEPPYFRLTAPPVWTTLELTIRPDGSHTSRVAGASIMPRHWFYDSAGELTAKSGVIDFKAWARDGSDDKTPWGDSDSPALVTAVASALERELSTRIMRGGAKPQIRKLAAGDTLSQEGESGDELFLVLDGVLDVEVGGTVVAEVGPGALLGERAILEGGLRTATLRAVTPLAVAVAGSDAIDRTALEELATGHRREEQEPTRAG